MARSAVYRPAIYDAFRKSHEIEGATAEQTDYQVKVKTYYGELPANGVKWRHYSGNPILEVSPGEWDVTDLIFPRVIKVGDTYYLYYSSYDTGFPKETGLATSSDGISFTKIADGIGGTSKVLAGGGVGDWDRSHAWSGFPVYHDGTWYLFYTGRDKIGDTNIGEDIGVATSPDGKVWTKYGANPILTNGGVGWRQQHLCHCSVVWDADNSKWVMIVGGMNAAGHETIGRYWCTEANFPYTWTEDAGNPVIDYGEQGGVDDYHAFHPQIYPVKVGGLWYVFYTSATAAGDGYTISHATINSLYDGAFTKCANNPVLSPSTASWEDTEVLTPHVAVKIGDDYYMYYLGDPGVAARAIGLARSTDITADDDELEDLSIVALHSHARTDFGDVRFTASDGETELDYVLIEKVDSDYAIFWVEIPTIPVDPGTVTIYIFYGKEDATTTSNIENTSLYNIGDNFNDNSRDVGIWDEGNPFNGLASVAEANQRLEISGTGDGTAGYVTVSAHDLSQIALMVKLSSVNLRRIEILIAQTKTTSSEPKNEVNNYALFLYNVTDNWYARRTVGGVRTDRANGAWASNEEFLEIRIDDGTIYFYEAGVLKYSEACAIDESSLYIYLYGRSFIGYTGTDWFDTFFIRKYVSPEPLHLDWGDEEPVMWPF